MDDNNPPAHPTQWPTRGADMALASFVGREFVEALDAGLRRAGAAGRRRARPEAPSPAAPESAPEPPVRDRQPDPVRRADLAVALLSRHAAAILRRFETALPMVMIPGGVSRRVSRLSLTVWARSVLRTAMRLDEPATTRTAPPAAEQQVIAAALLLECAATTLPAGHPAGAEAIGALARAIRTRRTDPVVAARSAVSPVSVRRP
ncbi:hypothetical protein [Streptomyces sp. AK02-01A]|uniref:hypothetical protein n=1 Tax=Streptomyces sp. AK02-01A TaxID=3028648 RepID=UPI0029AF4ACE|nr:hypothetical protein [Streptomyces sp. AK02-01A]MDX3853676.1 hypothetical protein [Streptomyces sp. AK02-01A]